MNQIENHFAQTAPNSTQKTYSPYRQRAPILSVLTMGRVTQAQPLLPTASSSPEVSTTSIGSSSAVKTPAKAARGSSPKRSIPVPELPYDSSTQVWPSAGGSFRVGANIRPVLLLAELQVLLPGVTWAGLSISVPLDERGYLLLGKSQNLCVNGIWHFAPLAGSKKPRVQSHRHEA